MKATVHYWVGKFEEKTGLKHGQIIDGKRNINKAIHSLLEKKLHVMLLPNKENDNFALCIDDRRFTQR